MKLIKNTGDNRVIDEFRAALEPQSAWTSPLAAFSLFAFGETKELLERLRSVPSGRSRLILMLNRNCSASDADRPFRNRLNTQALARQLAAWVEKKVDLRGAPMPLPQSLLGYRQRCRSARSGPHRPLRIHDRWSGSHSRQSVQLDSVRRKQTTNAPFSASWFDSLWNSLPATPDAKNTS